MNSIWMLAAAEAETNAQEDVITMEEAPAGQETQTLQDGSAPAPDAPAEQTAPSPFSHLIMIVLIFGVMYLFLFRGPKKKQQEHQKMVQALKKNDRVRTIGGIIGTVLDVRDDEIVLKIDESTNTKMRVIPAAIATVLSEKAE